MTSVHRAAREPARSVNAQDAHQPEGNPHTPGVISSTELPGGITKVEGMAAARPGLLMLDRDPMLAEPLAPGVEILAAMPSAKWPGLAHHAREDGRPASVASQPGRPAASSVAPPEKIRAGPTSLPSNRQAENVAIERLGLLEVVGINRRLHNALDRFHDVSPTFRLECLPFPHSACISIGHLPRILSSLVKLLARSSA